MSKITSRTVSSAPLDVLFDIGRQVQSFPRDLPNLKSIKILETSDDGKFVKAVWTAEARPVKLKHTMMWVQEDRWDEDARCCRFQCAREGRGHFKHMSGSWKFTPLGDSTEMVIDVDYEMDHPLLRIHPFAVKLIDNILKENNDALLMAVKRRAEGRSTGEQ